MHSKISLDRLTLIMKVSWHVTAATSVDNDNASVVNDSKSIRNEHTAKM